MGKPTLALAGLALIASLKGADPAPPVNVYLPSLLREAQAGPGAQLTFAAADDRQPAAAPDGLSLVFVSDRAGRTDLFRLDFATGAVTNLTETPAADEATPAFAPDGSLIAFASNRGGDWALYTITPAGANPQKAIDQAGSDELEPAFTLDSAGLYFSSNAAGGNWDLYRAPLRGSAWTRLTDHAAADRQPALSGDGRWLAFRSERDGNSEIYLADADGSHARRLTDSADPDGSPTLAPDGSGLVYRVAAGAEARLRALNAGGGGVSVLDGRPGWQSDTPWISPDSRWLYLSAAYAGGPWHLYRLPYTSPLDGVARRGAELSAGNCGWEGGTWALGVIQAWRVSGRSDGLDLVRDWISACIPVRPTINHVNDGLLGYAALVTYQVYGGPERLAFAQKVASYLLNTAPRAADGTLFHAPPTVWDDTLLGVVPFLLETARFSGQAGYADEAYAQIIKHAAKLQNAQTGLFFHAWSESTGSLWPVFWGRGNGWVLLALGEALAHLPLNHPQRPALLSVLQQQAAGLQAAQAGNGLWHTALLATDTYQETSASALIGYGLGRAASAGWVGGAAYTEAARAARWAVWRQVQADGTVAGVSAPTAPQLTPADYNAVPVGAPQPYGQGAALLLLSAP